MTIPDWLVHFLFPGPLPVELKRLVLLLSGHIHAGASSLCYILY